MSPKMFRVLVVDDEENILSYLKDVLSEEGYVVFTAGGGKEACEIAEREQPHLAMVDMVMKDISGLEVLKALRDCSPGTRVIIMTAYATVETAVKAMKEGAVDYLIKPFSLDELKIQLRRVFDETALMNENRALRHEVARRGGGGEIIGNAPALLEAVELARKAAASDTTVLLLGETGTGKELVARLIHRESPRSAGPFLAMNCGAVPETLLERELFGHEKGSFTGADAMRPGLVEAASDGTLLLDEIGDMPPALQVKLLRVLEGHEFLRVGGTKPQKSRVRFVALTNRDLTGMVKEGKFREDLYYRLNVVSVALPSLRERGKDTVLLAEHFLRGFSASHRKGVRGINAEAKKALQSYPWPGNVRELRNVMERAVIVCEGEEVAPDHLGIGALRLAGREDPARAMRTLAQGSTVDTTMTFREAHDAFEKAYISRVLKECGGNISKTAERIGLARRNLHEKIKKYGLKAE